MKQFIKALRKFARDHGYDVVKHKSIPELLKLHNVDLVVDIGANTGGFATEIREAGWTGRIESVEPQPNTFKQLKNKFSSDPLWNGRQIGLGSQDTTLSMNVYEMDVLSSFLEKIEDNPVIDRIEVEVRRMDGLLDEILKDSKRPFVKIDTQGFEMEILEGFGDRINDVVGWQLELSIEPLYEKQPPVEDVIAKMRSLGYSLWRVIPGLRDPHTLRAFEFDGVFFRKI